MKLHIDKEEAGALCLLVNDSTIIEAEVVTPGVVLKNN